MVLENINRIEVIDHTGDSTSARAFHKLLEGMQVEVVTQDNNRTVKIFISRQVNTWDEPINEADAAMFSMSHIYEMPFISGDQEAWQVYYALIDNGMIKPGELATENQVKLVLDKWYIL